LRYIDNLNNRKKQCFYAVFKDFTGAFTKGEPGLAIMTSVDVLIGLCLKIHCL